MQRGLLIVVLSLLAVPGARGGFYSPPPPDVKPVWSPDSSVLVYYRFYSGLHVVNPDGSGDRLLPLPSTPYFAFSRDWHWIALDVFSGTAGRENIVVSRPNGSEARVVAQAPCCLEPSFSPDGTRIAYKGFDEIWTVGVDGSDPRRVAAGAMPAWSPDGRRIAFFDGRVPKNPPIAVLDLDDGTLTQVSVGDEDSDETFAWSPDGSHLAFVARRASGSVLAIRDFANGRTPTFPVPSRVSQFTWTQDGSAVVFAGPRALRVDVRSGAESNLGDASWDLALSPDGRRLAYSSGGNCGDRTGIYVRTLGSPEARRITNDCHVYGTNGPDRLTSSDSLYQIVDGLGGNDTLIARGAPYVGDELDGGAGNDVLRGGFWPDKLDGGPGDDTIYGGVNHDILIGGPGRDKLYGQGGSDVIYARDGERDVVDCGTNTGKTNKTPENDVAYVDRFDVVRHCEHVHRSKA